MTRQRRQILDALRQVNNHPTADEVYEMVRRRIPRISLGTVYRNLEILAELGEIQKLEFGGTAKRFDARQGLHYHIRCTCCDRVDDAPIGPVTHFETELAGVTEYRIIGHRLEFIGLCAACAREMISPGLQRQSRRLAPASAQRQVRPEAQTGEPRTRS
jgi:Fur family ferric uptake transcriptional regulator